MTQHVVHRQYFVDNFAQTCYRCGGKHSGLLCSSPDAGTLRDVIAYQNELLGDKTRDEGETPFHANSSSNRPQCVNCGSQRHVTAECYFPVQNELRYQLYLTLRQRMEEAQKGKQPAES